MPDNDHPSTEAHAGLASGRGEAFDARAFAQAQAMIERAFTADAELAEAAPGWVLPLTSDILGAINKARTEARVTAAIAIILAAAALAAAFLK